jgi:cell shape-determining protein MreD
MIRSIILVLLTVASVLLARAIFPESIWMLPMLVILWLVFMVLAHGAEIACHYFAQAWHSLKKSIEEADEERQ